MSKYNHGHIEWENLFDEYAKDLLAYLGLSVYDALYQGRHDRENAIITRLRTDPVAFVQAAESAGNGTANLDGISRAAVICQMIVYDEQGGPEGDWKEKALRRHWYAYFKSFAQMLAFALGKVRPNDQGVDEMVDLQWSSRLSKCYALFVDSGKVTYQDLWVEDASRRMEIFGTYDKLIPGYNLFVAVEKDSLYDDFINASKAVGAIALVSGKGKMSKAATELLLRKLGWNTDNNPFEGAVSVVALSDYDYDGHQVIQPTFAEQMRRYLPKVYEERIGVQPEQVKGAIDDPWGASYQVKLSNDGYRRWSHENALFWAKCEDCGREQFTVGLENVQTETINETSKGKTREVERAYWAKGKDYCSACDGVLVVEAGELEEPHGYEVESLRSSDYYRAIVKAILRQLDFDFLVQKLREITVPETYSIKQNIREAMLQDNDRYQKIVGAIDLLEEARDKLVSQLDDRIDKKAAETIEETKDIWMALEDDPEPDDFEEHVVNAALNSWGSVWRPFSRYKRSDFITKELQQDWDFQQTLKEIDIEDFEVVVTDVINTLS